MKKTEEKHFFKKLKIVKKQIVLKKSRKKRLVALSKKKYKEKVIQIDRVTKVVTGGKKMTFRSIVVVGDTKRKVGVGVGRADDKNTSIEKAILNAKKSLISVPLTIQRSIPHFIKIAYGASNIMLRPARLGAGIVAGGPVRCVLELAGVKNILAKQFGSNNILNNTKATMLALVLLNEKIEHGRAQSKFRKAFYDKILIKRKTIRSFI